MGVKHQTGKQRKDKFYHLAKETGFRARSAFKLIQLNRKFEFLQTARVVVDLCAAPGSWMQVARQNMPQSAVCVGVDLVAIKPIPNCIALKEDITTDKCRQALKRELQTWRADVVMNDGAPNVGKSWLHDAFKQAELTLSALALATELLRRGGWFVTKVFRSKDYHALIWVFKMLFNKVHATKPQASRNESAEIFVVCQGYKAPDRIDPKFLSSRYVFGELHEEKPSQLQLGRPLRKAKALGYADGEASVYSRLPASQFVERPNFLELLERASTIVLDTAAIADHSATTDDIRAACLDIKVIGKAELKALIKWRKHVKADLEKEKADAEPKQVETELEVESEDELACVDRQIAELKAQQHADAKKKQKRLLRERRRILEKLRASGYSTEGRVEQSEQDLFALRDVREPGRALDVDVDDIPMAADPVERPMDGPAVRSHGRDGEVRDGMGNFNPDLEDRLDEDELQWADDDDQEPGGLGLDGDTEGQAEVNEAEEEDDSQLLVDDIELVKGAKVSSLERRSRKAELWFEKDVFKSIEDDSDEDFELDQALKTSEERTDTLPGLPAGDDKGNGDQKPAKQNSQKKSAEGQDLSRFASDSEDEANGDDEEVLSTSDSDSDGADSSTRRKRKRGHREPAAAAATGPGRRTVKLTAEELALGSILIHSKKARRDIVDASYNRFAFNDTHLPAWFVDDEKRHMRWRPELDPELLAQYKDRLKQVDARPIKKVAEAKARKKRRLQKRLDKAKQRAENIIERQDVSTVEKARELRKVYARARSRKQQEVKYVVAKKATSTGKRAARPAGVKGHYKMVDPRMKKEVRAMKRAGKVGRSSKTGRAANTGRGKSGGRGKGHRGKK